MEQCSCVWRKRQKQGIEWRKRGESEGGTRKGQRAGKGGEEKTKGRESSVEGGKGYCYLRTASSKGGCNCRAKGSKRGSSLRRKVAREAAALERKAAGEAAALARGRGRG